MPDKSILVQCIHGPVFSPGFQKTGAGSVPFENYHVKVFSRTSLLFIRSRSAEFTMVNGLLQGWCPCLFAPLPLRYLPYTRIRTNAGFVHLRYVDDFRIFCKNTSEAKKALIELTRLLRKRGLNLQSSKTKILTSSEALVEIEGLQPVIGMVAERFEKAGYR